MSGKLFYLECKKVWKDFRFWLLLAFLVFLQCFLLYRKEVREHIYPMSAYRALYEQLAEMKPKEAAAYLKGRKEMLFYLQNVSFEENLKRPSWNSAWPDRLYTDETGLDGRLFDVVEKEACTVVGRDRQFAETLESAGNLGKIRLFQSTESEYVQKNREKTEEDFLKAESVPVDVLEPEQGIRLGMENGLGDAFVLLLIFFTIYLMVFQGYETGIEIVVAASKNGREQLFFNRSLALLLCTGLIWAAMFGSSLLCGACWYSLGNIMRPVQALSDYVTCLWDLNVCGLLFLTFLGKWLIFGAISLLLLGLLRLERSVVAPCGVVFALFWLGYFLWRGIADSSLYRPLRYLNLYYLLRPDMAFCVYRNLNLFEWPVSCWIVWSVGVGGFLIGSMILLVLARNVLPREAGNRRIAVFWENTRKKVVRKRRGRPHIWAKSLLAAEFYKAWWMRKLFFLFVIMLALQIWNYSGKEWFQGAEERMYQNYLVKWQREIDGRDEELRTLIREEEKRVQEALAEAGGSNAAELRYEAFIRAQARFFETERVAGIRDKNPWLIYEGVYELLVADPKQDTATGCLAFLLLLVAVIRMTGHEYPSGMRVMLRTMERAGRRYFTDKIVVLWSVCLAILLIVYVPDLWLTAKTWPLDTLGVPVYSLPAYGGFPLTVSIGGYLGILYTGRFLVLLLTGSVMLIGMEFLKNELIGVVTLGVVLGLPYLLYYISGAAYGQWGLLKWLGFNGMLQK